MNLQAKIDAIAYELNRRYSLAAVVIMGSLAAAAIVLIIALIISDPVVRRVAGWSTLIVGGFTAWVWGWSFVITARAEVHEAKLKLQRAVDPRKFNQGWGD